jgi:lipoprotein-releasing system permease protein
LNFPLFLALKYLKPKRSVASVITCVSIIGVMLGFAVVIIVRSVMTGFGDQWREKIL